MCLGTVLPPPIWFVHLWGGGLVIIHIWFYLMMYKIFPLYWYSPCTSAIYDVIVSLTPFYDVIIMTICLLFHHGISPYLPPPFPSLIIERSKYSYKKNHNLFSNYYIKQGVKAFVSALPSKGLVLIILIWFNHEVIQKTLKSLYKTWCKGICERSVFGRFALIILKWFNHEVMQKTLKSLYKNMM